MSYTDSDAYLYRYYPTASTAYYGFAHADWEVEPIRIYGPQELPRKANLMRDYMSWLDTFLPKPAPVALKPFTATLPKVVQRQTVRDARQTHVHQQARREHRRESPRPRTKLRKG